MPAQTESAHREVNEYTQRSIHEVIMMRNIVYKADRVSGPLQREFSRTSLSCDSLVMMDGLILRTLSTAVDMDASVALK